MKLLIKRAAACAEARVAHVRFRSDFDSRPRGTCTARVTIRERNLRDGFSEKFGTRVTAAKGSRDEDEDLTIHFVQPRRIDPSYVEEESIWGVRECRCTVKYAVGKT